MTTQVIFKIDDKLKKAAQTKAKKEGISLADIYKHATRLYVDGLVNVGLVSHGTLAPNAKTGRELLKSRKEIEKGIGLPGPFTSTEMDAYLDNLK